MKYTKNQLYRHSRRWLLIIFRPYYVMRSLSKKRGSCKNCGCCGFSISKYCKYWDKKKHCLRWNNLPFMCRIYPIDEKDKNPFTKKNCGFYWEKN